MNESPAVLIIAYKRPDALKALLSMVALAQNPNIYVALDSPKEFSDRALHESCVKVIKDFRASYVGQIQVKIPEQNLGCAASVVLACRWIFQEEEFAIILEDDCMPGAGFFEFAKQARTFIDKDPMIMMACGTQFAPNSITMGKWSLSKYPLIWGWATSRAKWNILDGLLRGETLPLTRFVNWKLSDLMFWRSGAKRSLSGFVDAWDIPLVYFLQLAGLKVILPGVNLVTNIGDDEVATHTGNSSPWLRLGSLPYQGEQYPPTYNSILDNWLRDNFYKITSRHIVTTRITALMDLLCIHKVKRPPLRNRI